MGSPSSGGWYGLRRWMVLPIGEAMAWMEAPRPHVMQLRYLTLITGDPWFARMTQAFATDVR